jgi:glycosyltransferase involved in cell wall biosynthesis
MFALSSMPVGGAETLLVNLVQRLDRSQFLPEIACLKTPGVLGELLAETMPVHAHLLRHKFDVRVLPRLARLFRQRSIDALVTVGCGDKMFWGRLAARIAGVPVVVSALHSTGWPDGVGWLNRQLTFLTDAFIAVAEAHGRYLIDYEGFPESKLRVIPNGVDVERFRADETARSMLRAEWNIDPARPVCTIVAALRPEKNHLRFLRIARLVKNSVSDSVFLVVGDGDIRPMLQKTARSLGLDSDVFFLGSRSDVPQILAASDVFLLTSDNEASPVSILEAMACELPIVASDVGSVHQTVSQGGTGFLVPPPDEALFAQRVTQLLADARLRRDLGRAGRRHVVDNCSLDIMVRGYSNLIDGLYDKNYRQPRSAIRLATRTFAAALHRHPAQRLS